MVVLPTYASDEPLEELITKLKQLGFNGYEAKVYLALLRQHPATGYEVSQASGVPQAKVYEILRTLEGSQIVVSSGQKPATYLPVSPDELLERCERSFRSNIAHLREVLPAMSDGTVDPVINLRGETSIYRQALEMLQHATQTVYLEVFRQDLPLLEKSLEAARQRGVQVRVVGYNEATFDGADQTYHHQHGELIEQSLGGRYVIISVDDQEGLVGTLSGDNSALSHAVYTRNPGIVLLIKMLVVHDMYLIDVESQLGDQMRAIYGPGLLKLKEKILGGDAVIGFH